MRTPEEIEAQKKKVANELATLFKKQKENADLLRQAAASEKGAYYQDRDNQLKPQKNELLSEAKKLYESGQYGYDTWAAAMSNLLANDLLIAKYINAILPDEQAKMMDRLSIVGQKLGFGETPIFEKPGVDFDVEFDAHNKMIIKNLKRNDKHEFTHAQEDAIKRATELLLIEQGYTKTDGVFYNNVTREVLTQAQFDENRDGFRISEGFGALINNGVAAESEEPTAPRPF